MGIDPGVVDDNVELAEGRDRFTKQALNILSDVGPDCLGSAAFRLDLRNDTSGTVRTGVITYDNRCTGLAKRLAIP